MLGGGEEMRDLVYVALDGHMWELLDGEIRKRVNSVEMWEWEHPKFSQQLLCGKLNSAVIIWPVLDSTKQASIQVSLRSSPILRKIFSNADCKLFIYS